MTRMILLVVLLILVARAIWLLLNGIVEGATGRSGSVANRRVNMVRDPVCGTFVIPTRAVTLPAGRGLVYFCSTACRDKYRARSA